MTEEVESPSEFSALQTVIGALQPLSPDDRRRIFAAVATFLQIEQANSSTPRPAPSAPESRTGPSYPPFTGDTSMSPKEFLLQKQPRSDLERIATLAYYLTHYRETPYFKTLDLSKLNTEAAQPKFSNAAYSTANAVKRGYLVPTTKGQRQLSAAGEQFVRALPDRDAAKAAMAAAQVKRTSRRSTSSRKKALTASKSPK